MTEPGDDATRYRGVRALVLGASGFIGRWVARTLCAQGASVCLVVRDKVVAKKVFSNYCIRGEIIELDLRSPDVVGELFQKIKPSITFNLAGYGVDRSERDEKTAYQINAGLVKVICDAIAQCQDPKWLGQDIILVGSAFEYGAIGGRLSEDSIPTPTTHYERSKLAGTISLAILPLRSRQGLKFKGDRL